jgi:hypothetical protein
MFFLILFLAGCEKDPKKYKQDTIIYGRITDLKTDKPIESATIYLMFRYFESIAPFVVDSVLTDIEGKYEMKFTQTQQEYLSKYGVVYKEGYNPSNVPFKSGEISETNVSLIKNSYINFHIKNITPFDSDDQIILYGFLYFGMGQSVDTVFTYPMIGGSQQEITWRVIKNNHSTYYGESIFFPSGDTVYRTIYY